MNSARSGTVHEASVRFGAQHGYRVDGDRVHLHADVELPRFAGGKWTLELWANDSEHPASSDVGTCVAKLDATLPAAIAPLAYSLAGQVEAQLPPHGKAYAMSLVLREAASSGDARVGDVVTYPRRELFPAPHIVGAVGYRVIADEVELSANDVANPRPFGNVSGSLSLELWAERSEGGKVVEHCMASATVDPIQGGFHIPNIAVRVPFSAPPAGSWCLSMRLREWSGSAGLSTRDRREFDALYVTPSPALPAASASRPAPAAAAALPTSAAHTAPASRPAPAASPAPAAAPPPAARPATSASPRLISVQTASADEIVAATGLPLKVAKEIVKSRPFKSLDDLVKVSGIGEKRLQQLRKQLTL
ncbi:MAG: helix-hairpin-helix domain-containing protein [Polyangiaceae bacterium]